ncbi:MAG: radical SAM protein [Spirochaetales bacterium]|nr:radical SAM protein [Spirochaetales bacterium]
MIPLIFPPVCSPTYVPLGVSALKSYCESLIGADSLHVTDLNILYWNHLGEKKTEYGEYLRFVKGEQGLFNREFYESHSSRGMELKRDSALILNRIRTYLDRGEANEELEAVFLFLEGSFESFSPVILFSCLFPDQLLFTLGFTRWLRSRRECRLFLGGASTLLVEPQDLLNRAPWIEGVFTGEGEQALAAFLLQEEQYPIPGLYRRREGFPVLEAPLRPQPMDSLPPPDFSWADLRAYHNPVPVLPVQLSRGCKWRRCRFCAHNFSFGRYRCSDPIAAVDLLEGYVRDYGVRDYYITDQYLDGSFLEPFARELLERNLYLNYTFMGRPAEDMTAHVLDLLSRSGCKWISWGVESGCSRLLDRAGKGTAPDTVAQVLCDAGRAGINNLALMIFGLPESDDQALEETISFLQENREWIDSLTASEFQLYLGTPFGNHPEKYRLRITGREVFCRIEGEPLHSVKVPHRDIPAGDELEIMRGPHEAKRWKRHKIWLYPDDFWETLPSEHYLILNRKAKDSEFPEYPDNPLGDAV